MRTLCLLLMIALATGTGFAETAKAPDGTTLTVPSNFGRSSQGTRDDDWYTTWWDRKKDWHISWSAMALRRKTGKKDMALVKKSAKKRGAKIKTRKITGALDAISYVDEDGKHKVVAVTNKRRYVITFRFDGPITPQQATNYVNKVTSTLTIR